MLIEWDPICGAVATSTEPLIGTAVVDLPTDIEVDGQAFTCISARPYTCRDGRDIQLYRWRSDCQACGAPYHIEVASTRAEFEPQRRCKSCRKPTSKVAAEERRLERAAKVRALYEADPTLEAQYPRGLPDYMLDPELIR